MSSVDNSGADANRFYIRTNATANATTVTSAEVKNRIKAGLFDPLQKPSITQQWVQDQIRNMAQPPTKIEVQMPDKRAKNALDTALVARRATKPTLAPNPFGLIKRYTSAATTSLNSSTLVVNTLSTLNTVTVSNTLTVSNTATVKSLTANNITMASTAGSLGTALGNKIVLYPVSTPSTSDYAIGVASSTLFYNSGPSAKHSFCVNGTEYITMSPTGLLSAPTISCAGDVGAGSLNGSFMGRVLGLQYLVVASVTSSTRFDIPSTFVALGTSVCIESEVTHWTSGGLVLNSSGVVFTMWSKKSGAYTSAAASCYGTNSYGSYITLPFNATFTTVAGSTYSLAVTVAPTAGNSVNATFNNFRITYFA